jgi:hypothetical protein
MSQDIVENLDAYLVDEVSTFSVPHWLMQKARDEVAALREQVKAQQKLRANLVMQNVLDAFELEPWMLEYFLAEPELKAKLFEFGDLINQCRTVEPAAVSKEPGLET